MSRYLEKIDLGLVIEKPNIFLPWSATKNEVLNLNKEFENPSKNYYTLKVRLYDIPFVENLGIQFIDDSISKVDLYYKHESEKDNIRDNFSRNQKILEQQFGKSSRQSYIEKFFTKQNKADEEYKWQFKQIKIFHKIYDRFGLEESVSILVRK